MTYYVDANRIPMKWKDGNGSKVLLEAKHGCVHDCMTGVSYNYLTEYPQPQAHEFQEGFYVISGRGYARVGEQEFPVYPGISFLAPAHVNHAVKTDNPDEPVVVFWFHAQ